jgi:hypothetical protein
MARTNTPWNQNGLEETLRTLAEEHKKRAPGGMLYKTQFEEIADVLVKMPGGKKITWDSARQKLARMAKRANAEAAARRRVMLAPDDGGSDLEPADGYASGENVQGLLGYRGHPPKKAVPCQMCSKPKRHHSAKCSHCQPVPKSRQGYTTSQRNASADDAAPPAFPLVLHAAASSPASVASSPAPPAPSPAPAASSPAPAASSPAPAASSPAPAASSPAPAASSNKRKLSDRFRVLKDCKEFLTDEQYKAKFDELLSGI